MHPNQNETLATYIAKMSLLPESDNPLEWYSPEACVYESWRQFYLLSPIKSLFCKGYIFRNAETGTRCVLLNADEYSMLKDDDWLLGDESGIPIGHSNGYDPKAARIDLDCLEVTDDAFPTSRCLTASTGEDSQYAEEWYMPAMLPNGQKCFLQYLFLAEELIDEAGEDLQPEDYNWDLDHVHRVILA